MFQRFFHDRGHRQAQPDRQRDNRFIPLLQEQKAEPGKIDNRYGLGAAEVVGSAGSPFQACQGKESVNHIIDKHRSLEGAAFADKGHDGEAAQVIEEHIEFLPAFFSI